MTEATALLPCPFCGCTDVSNNDDGDYEWYECDWCHATSGFDPVPEFEGNHPSFHWNRRASIPAGSAEATDLLNAFSIYTIEEGEGIRLSTGGICVASYDDDTPEGIALLKLEAHCRALRAALTTAGVAEPVAQWQVLGPDGWVNEDEDWIDRRRLQGYQVRALVVASSPSVTEEKAPPDAVTRAASVMLAALKDVDAVGLLNPTGSRAVEAARYSVRDAIAMAEGRL